MKANVKLLPAMVWFGLILYLLTLPGEELPQVSWMDALQVDKWVHVSLFFILVALTFWGIVSTKPGKYPKRLLFSIAFAALVYGIALEFVQKYWIPHRSFDQWDIVADGVGSFLPFLVVNRWKKRSLPR